jgi:hypothetical protein
MNPNQQERLTAYLTTHPLLSHHVAAAARGEIWIYAADIQAPELARQMLDDAEFRALGLGTWLNTPTGEILAGVVVRVIPSGYEPIFSITVDALRLAADEQSREGRRRAGGVALAVLLVAAAIAVLTDA